MALPVGTIVRQADDDRHCCTVRNLDDDHDDAIHVLSYARLDEQRRWRPCSLTNLNAPSKKVDPWRGQKIGFVYTTRNTKTSYFKDAPDSAYHHCLWSSDDDDENKDDVIIYEGADFFIPGTFEWIPDYDLKNRIHLKLIHRQQSQHILIKPQQGQLLHDFVKNRFNLFCNFRILRADRTPIDFLRLKHRDTLIVHDATHNNIRRGREICVSAPHSNIHTLQNVLGKRKHHGGDDDDDDYEDDDDDYEDNEDRRDRRGALRHLNQAIDSGKIITFFEQDFQGTVRVGCQFAGVSKLEAATFFQDIFSTRIREVIAKADATLNKRNKKNRI